MKEQYIVVLIKLAGNKYPVASWIPNDLSAMQETVGGTIKVISIPSEWNIKIVCNENEEMDDLDANIFFGKAVVHGDVFIAGTDNEGNFISLTKEQRNEMAQYVYEIGVE
jgi:hypothetical protein